MVFTHSSKIRNLSPRVVKEDNPARKNMSKADALADNERLAENARKIKKLTDELDNEQSEIKSDVDENEEVTTPAPVSEENAKKTEAPKSVSKTTGKKTGKKKNK